ncbi:cadherin-like domain-containing protein, partial [Vibrio sp. F13]|uniref:Ig-like domain-containing protein n=1 Tax=Vibrio sp. F13 TaxID=2070777 RepID=UPI0010BD838D
MRAKLGLYVSFFLLLFVYGCGPEGAVDNTEDETLYAPNIAARDGMVPVSAGLSEVSVSPYVEGDAVLSSVTLTSGSSDCEPSSQGALSLNITLTTPTTCRYQYRIAPANAAYTAASSEPLAHAQLIVVPSVNGDPALPPIPVAMEVNSVQTLDIPALLGSDFPTGYSLSQDYDLLGSGSVSIDSVLNTIEFTTGAQGLHRIIYSLEGMAGGLPDTKIGTLDIAVSDTLNDAPVANNFTYPIEPDMAQSIIIDLTGSISSVDGDALALVSVNSMTSTVSIVDKDAHTFSFEAASAGRHYVSYAVSDARGGFAHGIVEVQVNDPSQRDLWEGVAYGGYFYSAPLTRVEAVSNNVTYSGVNVDDGYAPTVEVATFMFSDAQSYCASMGRLPTSAELMAMVASENPESQHNWPVGKDYVVNDGGASRLINLETGQLVGDFVTAHYVTCWY